MKNLSSSYTECLHREGSTLTRVPSSKSRIVSQANNSRVENYVTKLESLCSELKKKIRGNRPAIEEL